MSAPLRRAAAPRAARAAVSLEPLAAAVVACQAGLSRGAFGGRLVPQPVRLEWRRGARAAVFVPQAWDDRGRRIGEVVVDIGALQAPARLVGELAHQAVHQALAGARAEKGIDCVRQRYHPAAFRDAAADAGFLVPARAVRGVGFEAVEIGSADGPLGRLVADLSAALAAEIRLHGIPRPPRRRARNLVPYVCACDPPQAPRAWPPFRASCGDCGREFVRADGHREDA